MLEKLKNAIGIAEKSHRDREISRIGYSEEPSRLIVEFADGSMHTHLDVIKGHIVGLCIAEDKLDFYESQIEPLNPALEVAGSDVSMNTGPGKGMETSMSAGASAAAPEKRKAQS